MGRLEGTYRYLLEYGAGSVRSAQTISLSFPPRALRTRCVATFLSSTTNLWSSPPFTPHCCCRIGVFWPSFSLFFAPCSTGSPFCCEENIFTQLLPLPLPFSEDCFSIHWPTNPTTSSLVSISHKPSVAMTTKSPFEGSIWVV